MKLFKIILIISLSLISYSQAQNIAGTYKLTGFSAVSYDISRTDFPIIISDSYGLGFVKQGDHYNEGELINKFFQEPVPEIALLQQGVNLEVSFNADGSAFINEGHYPTVSTGENCIATETIPAITDNFYYDEEISENYHIPYNDIFGNESLSPYRGLPSGHFSMNGSTVFDNIPSTPTEVSVPFPLDNSVFEDSTITYLKNMILPGLTGGYLIYSTELASMIDGNPFIRPNLYLEWHAIDGELNETGLGDYIGVDEDGDGTDFDSIFGLENLRVFEINNGIINNFSCGSNSLLISGNDTDGYKQFKIDKCESDGFDYMSIGYSSCEDYINVWFENCIDENMVYNIGETQNLYSLELNAGTTWDGITTWNSIYNIPTDDSGYDYNPECETNNDIECSGRITFEFEAQCILSFNARYFMVELTQISCDAIDECEICNGSGEVIWYEDEDEDGYGNINSPSEPSCLPGMGYVANNLDPDDTCVNNHLNYDCNNECINDDDNDDICDEIDEYPNCTSNSVDCAGVCDGLSTLDVCDVCNGNGLAEGTCNCGGDPPIEYYNCDGDCLNDSDGDTICDELEIPGCTDVEAQNYNMNSTEDDESCEYLSVEINEIPSIFEIQNLYPNPFNPVVTISYGVPISQFIEGQIFNLIGESVSTLISQYQPAGNYSIKWNATGNPSGIYIFILKTESEVKSQKLVLLK